MSNISTYSTTAASNNSATPDGWPEGMPPSGVNDSARENMAAMAKLFKDQNGTLETAGTGTAYTLTTNNANATLAGQSLLVFNIHTINTGAATLNADSLGAKALQLNGAALVAGDLPQDVSVIAVYNAVTDVYDVIAGADGVFGTLTLGSGSITDSSNAIDFGAAALSTTGSITGAAITGTTATFTSDISTTIGANQVNTIVVDNTTDGTLASSRVRVKASAGDIQLIATSPSYTAIANAGDSALLSLNSLSGGLHIADAGVITHTFGTDGSINATGSISGGAGSSFGIAGTDGTLHVHTATAGSVTANTVADDLVIENSTSGGMSILVPDASTAQIFLGSPSNNLGARMAWGHSTSLFQLGTDKVGASTIISADDSVTQVTYSGASGSELATFAGTFKNSRIFVQADGQFLWGSAADQGLLSWDTNKVIVSAEAGNALELRANGQVAGTFDTSLNANFAGDVALTDGTLTVDHSANSNAVLIDSDATGSNVVQLYAPTASPILYIGNEHASTPMGAIVDFTAATPNNRTQYFFRGQDSEGSEVTLWSDGGADFTSDVIITGGDISATSTSATATGAQFTLYQNSASPDGGDDVGLINFDGENATGGRVDYGQIRCAITDTNPASEDGSLILSVANGGATSLLDVLEINRFGMTLTDGGATTITLIGGEVASSTLLTAQGVGFHGESAQAQAAHIANPTDLATAITSINALLVVIENIGLTAKS